MKFTATKLEGAYILELEPIADARGFFARGFCKREFDEHGLESALVQGNVSYNRERGTMRGLHRQLEPHEETKLMRCTRGAIFDVIVDVRPQSPTYAQWVGVELSAENRRMLFVPRGYLHGFQTLQDDSEVFYLVSEFFSPGAEVGARYDDPAFGIEWPIPVTSISDKDASWPDYLSRSQ